MLKRKSILTMAMVALLSLTLVACGGGNKDAADTGNGEATGETNTEATDDNILRVGMEAGYPPYNWTQSDDSNGAVPIEGTTDFAGGYDVEAAKLVAEALGKELLVVKTSWDGLPPAVQSGVIDVIMAGMSPTEERQKQIDFTDGYWVSDYVIIVQKGSEYENATSIADFAGAKLTGQLATLHYDLIDQIDGAEKQEAMEDFPQMRVALQSGIIDGYIGEVPEALSVEMATDNLVAVHFDGDNGFVIKGNDNHVSAGLKKGSELTEKLNEVFNALSEEDRQAMMAEAVKNQPTAN